jgi:hypothetical protein
VLIIVVLKHFSKNKESTASSIVVAIPNTAHPLIRILLLHHRYVLVQDDNITACIIQVGRCRQYLEWNTILSSTVFLTD